MTELRIKRLKESFDSKIDGILISNQYNRFYLSGFTGSSGVLVISKDRNVLITDSRYTEQAKDQCTGFEVVDQKSKFYETLQKVLEDNKIKSLGFEDNDITYRQYTDYQAKLKNINFVPTKGTVEKLREIKESDEVSKIRKAAQIADDTFKNILEYIKPGVTEKEIALEMEYSMKKSGASGLSFETIVASGVRSSMPHGVASDKKIEYGDSVTIDFGCIFEGYCSDMTRTVFVGKVEERIKDIYNIVLEAQEAALNIIRSGLPCKEADLRAREIISRYNFGEKFGHGLGHSLGLEIHEMPTLSPKSDAVLEPGMIVSVEPGIYIEGFGGVRIEDIVLITETGLENLASSSKDIILL